MDENWLQNLLTKEAEQLSTNGRGGISRLAEKLAMPRETVDRWASGESVPDYRKASEILRKLGGDVERAFPSYQPPTLLTAIRELEGQYGKPAEPIRVAGRVTGGRLAISGQDDIEETTFEDLWRSSPWWGLTNKELPIVLVQVQGSSMAPHYPDGSMIALRPPSDRRQVPNGAPCVFRQGGLGGEERTFKILWETRRGEIIGWPLNYPEHKPVVFRRGEVDIEYLVLGVLNQRVETATEGADLARRAVAQKRGK
jgi:phage repressor protein C with HTH and peptisase S24 domain